MTSPEEQLGPHAWRELVETMTGGAVSSRVLTGEPAPQPGHGRFASHTDLPTLTVAEAARMGPVFDAIYRLVAAHPPRCGCDPTVMAWRASYATAQILLRLPSAAGVFRRPLPDGGYVFGWRCLECPNTMERTKEKWASAQALRAYEDHMQARHSQEEL